MSRSVNRATLVGNVGDDPEVRTTAGGAKVARVSLATNEVWYDRQDQKQERTEWHRLTFWEKLADIVEQYVRKGDRLYVEGQIRYSTTEDDKGNVRYFTDINVRELVMLGSPTGGSREEDAQRPQKRSGQKAKKAARKVAPAGKKRAPFVDDEDDELPF